MGNVEGSLSTNNKAYFTGIGSITLASDFDLNSAVANSGTGISLNFSDAILDGSVYKNAFNLNETNTANNLAIYSVEKSPTNSKIVNLLLTGSTILDGTKNYQITVSNSGLATDLRRQKDNAFLGKNIITFPGYAT